ncbi:hypothetical protein [Cupriavidus sp. Marseille-Q8015]
MKLKDLAESCEWPHGLILDPDAVQAQALQAARFYCGFADIASLVGDPPAQLGEETDLTDAEWAVVRPLFMLYIERGNAIGLEASRNLGVEQYGRQVDTIDADIRQYEADLPRLAFAVEVVSV